MGTICRSAFRPECPGYQLNRGALECQSWYVESSRCCVVTARCVVERCVVASRRVASRQVITMVSRSRSAQPERAAAHTATEFGADGGPRDPRTSDLPGIEEQQEMVSPRPPGVLSRAKNPYAQSFPPLVYYESKKYRPRIWRQSGPYFVLF